MAVKFLSFYSAILKFTQCLENDVSLFLSFCLLPFVQIDESACMGPDMSIRCGACFGPGHQQGLTGQIQELKGYLH